ncbi:MAG TPA: hypothetical protein VG389_23745 [Myxococcota bacterium]|nr:hypothetical protein [Myxococcota bacterium]
MASSSPVDAAGLEARARRAYERGRLAAGVRRAWPVVPMAMLSLAGCQRPVFTLVAGAVLAAAAVGLVWRGEAWGRAVVPGLVAGTLPLLLPILVRQLHACPGGSCAGACLVACTVGGLAAGAALGVRAVRLESGRLSYLIAGAVIAGLTGALGCAVSGVAGVVGMAAGVVVASTPVVALSLASRRT